MDPSESDEAATRERANELYWDTEESVARIAEELDVSKGRLYGLIDPLASGLPCPRCSEEMEYPNRTARDRGFVTCPACDLEEEDEVVRAEWLEAARRSEGGTVVVSPGSGEGARQPPGAPGPGAATRNRILAGTALLGAAAGLALALWARKR